MSRPWSIARGLLLISVGIAVLPSTSAAADVLIIAPNHRVVCVVERETEDRVYFQARNGTGSVPKNVLVRIERASEDENAGLLAKWKKLEDASGSGAEKPHTSPESRPRVERPARGRVIKAGDETFSQIILQSNLPVLVDFYATWCIPYREQEVVVAQLAAEFRGKARFVRVDIDRSPRTAVRYGVSPLPTLIVFDKGKSIQVLTGVQSAEALRAALRARL